MMKKIHFSIDIKAPKERVWDVLWNKESFRDWTSMFSEESEGSYIRSDWNEGSRFEFFESAFGSYGIIEKLVPNELLLLRHRGELTEGVEHPYKDGDRMEQYKLIEKDGSTILTLDQDVPLEHKVMFEKATPKAFRRIKELAEKTKHERGSENVEHLYQRDYEQTEVEKTYADLLTAWNKQDAMEMASLFTDSGTSIGFDGSQYHGKSEIETEIGKIFEHHQTADYVWKVREVRFLHSGVAILRAVVGMIPPGKRDINPAANAIQTITTVKQNGVWKIALFQNTPAQFHGRPEMVDELTKELSAVSES
ncbi:SgcJ/EcaC family oxidoreductase [Negadavirga shengliensis]|uniref:SgcJ/EcaC family oxidoreductase n=1 Tax=Negadavirga shengliensis TaxID=1389218 RepID=A0ABV9T7Z7_9BACT